MQIMEEAIKSLEKINHTICLNLNEKRLKFNLDKYESCDCENLKEFVDCYCLIEQALDQAEKNEKVLEILKNKNVNIETLSYYLRQNVSDDQVLHWYNNYGITEDNHVLLKTEFNLIKEWLYRWVKV